MVDEISPSMGFPPHEAVWRLLKLKGYNYNLKSFLETYSVDGSPESILLPLEVECIQARMAILQSDEVEFLEVPTLLQIKDGSWVLLRERERKGLRLECPEGELWVPFGGLKELLGGLALDLSPSLPVGGASGWG